MARIIGEVRPKYAFVENSPMLTTRGLGVVLGDLAALGFDAEWGVLSAADVGANHLRERIWIIARNMANSNSTQCQRAKQPVGISTKLADIGEPCWWQAEPDVGRVANGVAFAMDRLKAIGNGQVPLCAATAFELLRERLNDN